MVKADRCMFKRSSKTMLVGVSTVNTWWLLYKR